MADFGSFLSTALGGSKDSSKSHDEKKVVHKSPTTNSYGKCLDALEKNFTAAQITAARRAIDKHDQNSFEEHITIGSIQEKDEGSSRARTTHKKILVVKGTYQFALIAHLKTIEMWVEIVPA
jgi:hypothetical protein